MEGNEDIGGGFTMNSALGDIADGLGLEVEDKASAGDDDGLGAGETVNEEVAAPAADAAAAPPAGEEKPAGEASDPAAPTAPAGDPLATAPRTWRPEAAAEWTNLSPTVKAEIAKREDDMFRGMEQYKGDAQVGKGFKQAIGRFAPVLQQYNIDPYQQVSGLMEAHFTLAMGKPEDKIALFQKLAGDYGVNLLEVAVAQPPYVDPQVERLQKELDSVKSSLTAEQQRRADEAKADFEKQVAKFQADPANPYFDELANDMAELFAKGMATNLRDAYDKALRLNPTVFAKDQARQQAETAKKAAEEAARKAAVARKATSANVRSSAKAGSAAAPLGSIDDTLEATYKAIMSRG